MSFHKSLRLASTVVLLPYILIQVSAGQSTPGTEPARGSLRWWAQKARSEGKSEIRLPAGIPEYPDEQDPLQIALMDNTVLVTRLLESKAVPYEFHILTWRKYRLSSA